MEQLENGLLNKEYTITIIICILAWTCLVNFSYFPAGKYKLKNVETTSNLNVEKTFEFCQNESNLMLLQC